MWKLWKRKWRSLRRNLERKVKVRLVQVAIRRSPPQKICCTSNQRAFVRRLAKVGWFRYGECRSPEQVEFWASSPNNARVSEWLVEQTYYSLTAKRIATWTAVERALTDRFNPKESRQVHSSTLRAKVRRPDEDLHQLRCDLSRLVELAYANDSPDIIICTYCQRFLRRGVDPHCIAWEGVGFWAQYSGWGPRGSSTICIKIKNQKLLNKGNDRVLSSTSLDQDKFGSQQGTQEPPAWARELFQQQAEIWEKLKSIPQERQGTYARVESGKGLRACLKCGS